MFAPFAKLVWNHEFAATDRLVTATESEIAFAVVRLVSGQLGLNVALNAPTASATTH